MKRELKIGDRLIGDGHPCYIIAEIGLNHNGDVGIAKKLIDAAALAGCDAVKFQKRTPELCVPPEQRDILRETPWGLITYLKYRHKVEFDEAAYGEIDSYCRSKGIQWFASCWDEPSVDFISQFEPACYKVASASLTDDALLRHTAATGAPVILSSGMSTMEEIRHAAGLFAIDRVSLCHATSTYPCAHEELNLRMIPALMAEFGFPIGYSGHEVGLTPTVCAVVLGASIVERHITLDRAMWGSDQAASIEPHGFMKLTRDIRVAETALGDGVKRVYKSEQPIKKKLRRVMGGA